MGDRKTEQLTVRVSSDLAEKVRGKFGDEILEAGFTSVPNLFIQHYHHLGLSDAEAMWVIHLLRFKWSADAPWPRQETLPMPASDTTRRRYARHLRNLGLLFTRRIYHTEETAPTPELVGKMKALEYHFDSLFHNTVRIHAHLATGNALPDFVIELPFEIVRKVTTGWFQDTPKAIKLACEQHLSGGALGCSLLLSQNGTVADKHLGPCQIEAGRHRRRDRRTLVEVPRE